MLCELARNSMIDSKTVFRAAILLPALLFVGSRMAVGQDAAAGRHLAETWCSHCHVVSKRQSRGTSTGAPTFPAIAAEKAITPMALRAFLQTPHHRMPDLHLSRDEIDDVSAYILSLRTASKP